MAQLRRTMHTNRDIPHPFALQTKLTCSHKTCSQVRVTRSELAQTSHRVQS